MNEVTQITRVISNLFTIVVNPSAWLGVVIIVLFFMFVIAFANAANKHEGNSEHISMFSLLSWLPICILAMLITIAIFVEG